MDKVSENLQKHANHEKNRQNQHTILAKYFPEIRTREEIYQEIQQSPALYSIFTSWNLSYQEEFLDCCSGVKGMKVLYDGIFKEIFNPENTPERLSELLTLLLGRKTAVQTVLPNDSVRLGAESSLLYTDIIVRLEDGSLANIEIQKIGYAFPGQRCACYSADHLLRQYKRVRGESGKKFNYCDIKQVYTIVFFEKSPADFHKYPDNWLHQFKQKSDTGLTMELLQEYLFIPLDIFRDSMENKDMETDLEAWLAFLSFTSPKQIEKLIIHYPRFQAMYQDIYELCQNTGRMINMYSKELEILDHNTVMYMIDELQEQCNRMKKEQEQMQKENDRIREENIQIRERTKKKDLEIAELRARLKEYQ